MFASSLLCRVAPRAIWKRRIKSWSLETGEAEEQILPSLCKRNKISVDVGAAAGTYAVRMLLHSSKVVAFEPNPQAFQELSWQFVGTEIVSLENVALSDRSGSVQMRIPPHRPMLGTIEASQELPETVAFNTVPVQRKRLDEYALKSVGFIKMDVEGHEMSVLTGGRETIQRERPNLLIEIGKKNIPDVCSFFGQLDYSGHFLMDKQLVPIERFDPAIHQNPANVVAGRRVGPYINNFVFFPAAEKN